MLKKLSFFSWLWDLNCLMVKRLWQIHHLTVSSISCFLEGVHFQYTVLLVRDFNMCKGCYMGIGEGRWRYMPCTWVEVSAWAADFITFRNPTHCLMLIPEDTSSPLQINFILHIKSLLRCELQLQTFPELQESFLGKCLTSNFDAVIWNLRGSPRPLGSWAEAYVWTVMPKAK